jgi:hypothetical protein
MTMVERSIQFVTVVATVLFGLSCSGDKHLPSSNPPEFDPKKIYATPASPTR